MLVVGCGVSGLTCAMTLLDAGAEIEIWGRETTMQSTSSVAAAFWFPFLVDDDPRIARWAALAYPRFDALTRDPQTGVSPIEAFDLYRHPGPPPRWADALPETRAARTSELPPGFEHGWVFRAFVIDTRRYLPWLEDQVRRAGGRIRQHTAGSLDEALAHDPVVINCAGLGARELCEDDELFPIRGQLARRSNPGIDRVWLDEHDDEIAYIVPRGDEIILGGTAERDDESLEPDPEQSRAIVRRCERLDPRVGLGTPRPDLVGVRPGRAQVRLTVERRARGTVIHNYGHSGAGITLSWGCAADVRQLAAELLPLRS